MYVHIKSMQILLKNFISEMKNGEWNPIKNQSDWILRWPIEAKATQSMLMSHTIRKKKQHLHK